MRYLDIWSDYIPAIVVDGLIKGWNCIRDEYRDPPSHHRMSILRLEGAVVGLMTESLEMSLEMGANQEFKYGQTINGKWRSKEVVARAHRISSNNYARYVGFAGKVLGVYGTINALKKTMEDPSNTANWVKLGANAGMLALKANPYTLVASIGFTVLDEGGYIDEWVGK